MIVADISLPTHIHARRSVALMPDNWMQQRTNLPRQDKKKAVNTFGSLTSRRHRRETGTKIPGGGGLYLALHFHHQNDTALRWAAMGDILMFH